MAGKPGRSGGARPNSGPKRKPPAQVSQSDRTGTADADAQPLEFLRQVMLGLIDPSPSQLKAAIAAAQYCHPKKGVGGSRADREKSAEEVAAGRFSPSAPPRLVAVNK